MASKTAIDRRCILHMFKKILEFKLTIIAKLILHRYKPMIIGVTGNVGKTTTKDAIATVVRKIHTVRVNAGNLNNELGLPMTIIGDWSEEYYRDGGSVGLWFKVLITGWRIFLFKTRYPEVLVLEYGADHPGDIKKLSRRYRPHISVVTEIGEIPVHVEYFGTKEAVAKEKSELIKILKHHDFAVLNHDNDLVRNMRGTTRSKVKTFGLSEGSDLRVSNFGYRYDNNNRIIGVTFKIAEGASFLPVNIGGSLGEAIALSSAAACAVGRILDMNLVQISEALVDFRGQPGRLRLLDGIKDSQIIDDTYNASPSATKLALKVLKEVRGNRKIGILGDMLELGEYTEMAHRNIGELASEFCDYLICVGSRAKFIAESAAKIMSFDKIFCFDDAVTASKKVQELIQKGDMVLIKGSQGMRMEKIVEEIMAEPERKSELLVRQSRKWLAK